MISEQGDQADDCIIMGAKAHFGLRRQSTATTALFHSGVILWCIERQVIRERSRS